MPPAHLDERAALEIRHSRFVFDRNELLRVSPGKHGLQHLDGGVGGQISDEQFEGCLEVGKAGSERDVDEGMGGERLGCREEG